MSLRELSAREVLRNRWLLPAAIFLSFFWQIWAIPLYDLDEGAFAEATREMLSSGNFITPQKDGEPRYDKPVLIYWLQAASVQVLGLNELALRLPSALAATLWVVVLWRFVREILDEQTATAAALVMVLSLQVSIIAKAAVADAVLNLFIALTFFEVYRYWQSPRRAPLLRAYLWMGLGFLTKGPVAVFFPVVVSLAFFWSTERLRDWLRAAFAPLGWGVFLLIAGPWYLAIYLDSGPGFFESFFLKHNVGRFAGVIHGHSGFFGYYFVLLPLILLPFTGWFLQLLTTLRRAWNDPLERFLWLWFGTVFVVFSLAATKLPHYLLYGSVPLFILMARHRERLDSRWLAYAPPMVLLVVLFFLSDILTFAASRTQDLHEQALLAELIPMLGFSYHIAIAAALAGFGVLSKWHDCRPWQGLILGGLIQVLVVWGVLAPRLFDALQAPVKEAAELARELDLPTVVYRTSMPSFSVYREAVTPDRPPQPGDLVFLRIDKLDDLSERYDQLRIETRYQRGAVALVYLSPRGQDD